MPKLIKITQNTPSITFLSTNLIPNSIELVENVPIKELKKRVKNYNSILHKVYTYNNMFLQVPIRRDLIEAILKKNPDTTNFRFYVASNSDKLDELQKEGHLLVVPCDVHGVDNLEDETVLLECIRPPECPNVSGAKLIEPTVVSFLNPTPC